MAQTNARHKFLLVIFGVLAGLLAVELILRLTGGVLLAARSFKEMGRSQKGNTVVLCIGESTTYLGYPEELEKALNRGAKKYTVINKGLPGTNSTLIADNLPRWLDQYRPDYLVTMMGINDPTDAWVTASPGEDLRLVKLFKWIAASFHKETPPGRESEKLFENDIDIFGAHFAKVPKPDKDLYYTAMLYKESRHFDKAEIVFKKLLEKEFTPELTDWFNRKLAETYFEQGKFDQWIGTVGELLKSNHNHPLRTHWIDRGCSSPQSFAKMTALLDEQIRANPESSPLYDFLAGCLVKAGEEAEAEKYFSQAKTLRLKYYNARTKENYGRLLKALKGRKTVAVFVQYPLRDIAPLEQMIEELGVPAGTVFVENHEGFQEALEEGKYAIYFTDRFAGDFGHMTEKGKKILAENIAEKIAGKVRP